MCPYFRIGMGQFRAIFGTIPN